MEIFEKSKEWQNYINDGRKYLKTAANGLSKRKSVFTPEIIYNIVSMSIEKNIMGYLIYKNSLPDNHTLKDLADGVRRVCFIEDELYENLIKMDHFQEICNLNCCNVKTPDEKDIEEFLDTGRKVQDFIDKQFVSGS